MFVLDPKPFIASIDVDAQYGFTPTCPNELPVPDGEQIAQALNEQAHYAQYRIGSKEAHPPQAIWASTQHEPTLSPIQGENVDLRWPIHCVPGSKGFELIKGLPHPTDYDFFVWKGVEPDMHPYGSCFHDLKERLSTGIIEFLQSKKVRTIIVGGLATDYCVKDTALQLLKAGFKVIINLSACRGLDPTTTSQALRLMKEQGAILIQSCQELQELSHA